MLRVVLAVAMAVALLGVSMPAVDDARITHANTKVQGVTDTLVTEARELAATSDAVSEHSSAGARRTLELHLPAETWGSSGLAWIELTPVKDATSIGAHWRVNGGTERKVMLEGALMRLPEGPLRIGEPGRARVTLRLVRTDDDRRVVEVRPGFYHPAGNQGGS